jgi:hypothetical protein
MLSKPTPPTSIRLQNNDLEVTEYLKLHLSYIDYITIRSELKYRIVETAIAAGTGETCQVTGWGGFFKG